MGIRLKLTYVNLMGLITLIWIISVASVFVYIHYQDQTNLNPVPIMFALIGGGIIVLIISRIVPVNLGLFDSDAQWIDGQR